MTVMATIIAIIDALNVTKARLRSKLTRTARTLSGSGRSMIVASR